MTTLPKHTKIKLNTIFGEELDATIIPLSIKGTMDIETSIENIKIQLSENTDAKLAKFKKSLDIENPTDDELNNSYVESKITIELSKLGEDVTEERIESQKKKRFTKLTEGKTREDILKELSDILLELDTRKQLLIHTVSKTLWNVLRKSDNLREHLFIDINEMESSIDTDTLINAFKSNVDETKIDEEVLKN